MLLLLADGGSPTLFVLVVIIVVGLPAPATVGRRILERRRRQALADLARQLGLRFNPTPASMDAPAALLHERGAGRKPPRAANVLEGAWRGVPVVVFDYKFIDGFGSRRGVRTWTVAAVRLRQTRLPRFAARPALWLDRWLDPMGEQNVILYDFPEFSGRWRIDSAEPDAVRATFTRTAIAALDADPHHVVEGAGDWVMLHRCNRIEPRAVADLLESALRIAAGFDSR